MKAIGIVGHGYVGQAVEQFLAHRFEVLIHDPMKGRNTLTEINDRAVAAVVCVPTAMLEDGSADTRIVEDTVASLNDLIPVVIKSTVPPGTTQRLAECLGRESTLCFSPEYIGEGGYPVPWWDGVPHPTDMRSHVFHIFGGSAPATGQAVELWKPVAGPHASYLQTDATTAELVKYATNAWIASKITFCNELYDIAHAFDVDYEQLRELWLQDGRIGRSHTLVFPDRRGFDGKCIPKDTNGLVAACHAVGMEPQLLTAILSANKRMRGE